MLERPYVLLVDDERDLIGLFRDYFRKFAPHILFAHSGNEAIEFLNKYDVGLIISDVNMADGDGIELLAFVRKMDRHIPFYFHTAVDASLLKAQSQNEIFEKPNGFPSIHKTIEAFFRSIGQN